MIAVSYYMYCMSLVILLFLKAVCPRMSPVRMRICPPITSQIKVKTSLKIVAERV